MIEKMLTENALQSNKNLQKQEISNLRNTNEVISFLSHHSNRTFLGLINYFAGMANNLKKIHPNQKTISQVIDKSVVHTNRLIKKGESLDFIKITHRYDASKKSDENPLGVMSNLYEVNPLFYDMDWRNALKGLIPAFKYLPISILLITSSITAKNNTPNLQTGSRREYVNGNCDYLGNLAFCKKANAYRVCAREEFAACQKNRQKLDAKLRESLVMNNEAVLYDNTIFSEPVRRAGKELKMSCAGMCSISSFNDMVINVALKRLETYSKRVDNPFGLFISICNQASKEMRMPVKHTKAYALASQFDIKLGKDAAILEGGNTPREPQRQNTQQREGKKLSTDANRHHAPTNKVSVLPLSALRSKNPSISMVGVKQISQGIVEIQHHNDIEWRETTQEERDIWMHTMQQARANMPQHFVQFMPKLEAPLQSKGDPNITAFKFYHIDIDNVLHDPDNPQLGCKLCDKKRKIC